ncbi:putative copper resistance protein D [Kineococcus xinjiangensis]|uniref:Putative copper resistance protein D n=1 Tax=Kineococcus xinjiangensis TaxID=512762 RepID=A0A2S6IV00_9ACTN|nr:cytochrome c oxidase assembly protein [Kineococcus xinjiangensis]PPK98105.1 putative copper resistance protein D [Kineococcus xinjiangensis]
MAAPAPPGPARPSRTPAPAGGLLPLGAGVLAAAVLAALVALGATGALTAGALGDPGATARYGLPVARTVHDLAAALMVGGLVLACTVLSRGSRAFDRALRTAAAAGAAWTLAAVAVLVLTYSGAAGSPLGAPGFGAGLAQFTLDLPLGRALLATTLLAAVATTAAAGGTAYAGAATAAAAALAALVPLSLAGHSAGSADHETAVTSLGLHLVAVTVWVGGLAALLAVWGCLAPAGERAGSGPAAAGVDRAGAARRYSTLALWCFAAVALSGVLNASVRLGGWSGLASGYGALLIAKTAALLVLGAMGWAHRRRTLRTLDAGPAGSTTWGPFARLAAGELVLMGAATGLGVALSRTVPPAPEQAVETGLAEDLLGRPLPPPATPLRWFTETAPDLLWLLVAAGLAAWYVRALVLLRRRGDRWPVGRTVAWLAGCLLLLWVTSGGPAAYGRISFSAHMLQHMLLTMAVPPLLVLGGPVTLALRTLPARRDGSRGVREWLLALVHSSYLRVLGSPVVAAVIFAGSIIVFYYTPLFEIALRTHLGHELMMVHFLGSGYLFASVLIGVDPGAHRPRYPLRLLLLFATMAFHAFFGVGIMQSSTLLAADWFQQVGQGGDLLADQHRGGGIAWGIGELPTLFLVLGVAIGWARSDTRENRRRDRAATRDGDAELRAYNEMLARMAERGPGGRS